MERSLALMQERGEFIETELGILMYILYSIKRTNSVFLVIFFLPNYVELEKDRRRGAIFIYKCTYFITKRIFFFDVLQKWTLENHSYFLNSSNFLKSSNFEGISYSKRLPRQITSIILRNYRRFLNMNILRSVVFR